jgi:hypothetical protein
MHEAEFDDALKIELFLSMFRIGFMILVEGEAFWMKGYIS